MSGPAKILLVEDDAETRELLARYLVRAGFEIAEAGDGRSALAVAREQPIDLVVLDLMIPELDGWAVCRGLRTEQDGIAIVIVSARTQEADRIRGLDGGADDYVTKPFSPREVVARVKAVLRRRGTRPAASAERLQRGAMLIDLARHRVELAGAEVPVTPTELRLLSCLATTPGRVFPRDELIESALGWDYDGSARTVDAHIRNLRAKIERDSRRPRWIRSVYGVGYRFEVAEEGGDDGA